MQILLGALFLSWPLPLPYSCHVRFNPVLYCMPRHTRRWRPHTLTVLCQQGEHAQSRRPPVESSSTINLALYQTASRTCTDDTGQSLPYASSCALASDPCRKVCTVPCLASPNCLGPVASRHHSQLSSQRGNDMGRRLAPALTVSSEATEAPSKQLEIKTTDVADVAGRKRTRADPVLASHTAAELALNAKSSRPRRARSASAHATGQATELSGNDSAANVVLNIETPSKVDPSISAKRRRGRLGSNTTELTDAEATPPRTTELTDAEATPPKPRQGRGKAAHELDAFAVLEFQDTPSDTLSPPAAKRRRSRKQQQTEQADTPVVSTDATTGTAVGVLEDGVASPVAPPKRITKKQAKADMRADILGSTFRESVMLHSTYTHIASHVSVPYSLNLSDQPTNPPLPNLGYACLSMTLREYDIYSSRDCNKKTMETKGLPHISQLALANVRDIAPMMEWNERHGIKFMRLSSCIFPWMSFYDMEDLPDWPEIKKALEFAGETAKRLGHRLTFHPSEFVKIAGEREEVTSLSIKELIVHAKIFDYMGFTPATHYNKINIHVGGVYGDKAATLQRFARVFHERLNDSVRRRLTVENDDRPSMFHVEDLMHLHRMTGIPIVFDFHHWKFCPGELSQKDALEMALTTWPAGVRPVVHWSESQRCRRPHAHSDYVYGPMDLYGHDADVDVMVEAKAKELAVLRFRQMVAEGADPVASRLQYEEKAEEEGGLEEAEG